MVTAPAQLDSYLDVFDELQERAAERDPGWLRNLRTDAMMRFREAGFPTTKQEEWRFTNVAALARTSFHRAAQCDTMLSARHIAPYRLAESACELIFVNGHFSPRLSTMTNLPPGLEISSLAERMQLNFESVEPRLARYADTRRDAFVALNTALFEDGAEIRILRKAVVELPIHLVYVTIGTDGPIMTHPRNLIVAEERSQATVIEDHAVFGENAAFSNAVTELVAGEEAIISHCMIERENYTSSHISTLRIEQARGSNVASHSVLLGGGLVRNNVHPVLAGQGAECLINGLFLGRGHQHLDNYMVVEHAGPNSSSRQYYNGILDEQAHGVFHGRIIVHKDAQKTDAKQTNRNLLLSDDARIDTKPQLEIHADDVKCTHGATIGQIDEDALYYLRSRGIDEAAARKLLLYAFASECVDRVKEPPVRQFIEGVIQQRLLSMVRDAHSAESLSRKEAHPNWKETEQ